MNYEDGEIIRPERELLSIQNAPSRLLNRVTVVERVYHQLEGYPAEMMETISETFLREEENCYKRPGAKVDTEWTKLDFAYLSNTAGMFVIRNVSSGAKKVIPSLERKAELEAKAIDLGFSKGDDPPADPFSFVPLSQSMRINVIPGYTYWLRSQYGRAIYNLMVIPR